jgi:hypothetical protein
VTLAAGAGPAASLDEQDGMETRDVARRVEAETQDVLATISFVRANPALTDRLFEQLVDLLLEGVLVDLRAQLAAGELTPASYASELATLAGECRAVGLLQRP